MSKTFAKNLKYYRQLAGMSQEDLGKAIGQVRGSVANYEIARSEPTFEVLCKAAMALGVSIDDLLKEREIYPEYIRQVQVTDEELALLTAYREASPVYREVALDILKTHKEASDGTKQG